MGFEKFTMKGRLSTLTPSCSLNCKYGAISFNVAAMDSFKIESQRFVILYFDKESNRIGMEFTDDKDAEGARRIVINNRAASVVVKNFLRCCGIFFPVTIRANFEKVGDLQVIQLPALTHDEQAEEAGRRG